MEHHKIYKLLNNSTVSKFSNKKMDCSLLVADVRLKKHLRRFNMFLFKTYLFITRGKIQNNSIKTVNSK